MLNTVTLNLLQNGVYICDGLLWWGRTVCGLDVKGAAPRKMMGTTVLDCYSADIVCRRKDVTTNAMYQYLSSVPKGKSAVETPPHVLQETAIYILRC